MSQGFKHLIRCRCILPQFKNLTEPLAHQFVVFSVIDDDDHPIVKFAQCNNCGIVHKVIDICRSEIITNRETMPSLLTIEDIKHNLPQNIVSILEANDVDIATWEAVQFIHDNKRWGEFIVLSSDIESGTWQGKYLQLLGESLFKVETFTREEFAKAKS